MRLNQLIMRTVSARLAEIAHQSVDNAVSVLVPMAEWLNERNESLKASYEMIPVAYQFVSATHLSRGGTSCGVVNRPNIALN